MEQTSQANFVFDRFYLSAFICNEFFIHGRRFFLSQLVRWNVQVQTTSSEISYYVETSSIPYMLNCSVTSNDVMINSCLHMVLILTLKHQCCSLQSSSSFGFDWSASN